MTGGKLVLPGPKMADGETLQQLIEAEGVTYSGGVPTVWLALADYLEKSGKRVPSLTRACSGGAALPQSLAERFDRLGVRLEHGWGMTEMSPIGTYNIPTSEMENLSAAEQGELRLKQGRAVYGVQMRICDDTGLELPRDGEAFGHLQVRGLFICSGYLGLDESDAHGADGWFDTGDVATIDAFGLMQITDRTKDVIKSGGEWISSIQLENAAIGHPAVAEAAVIGVPHPKWTERPLLIVVPQPGESPTKEDLLHFLADKVAKWWIPDDVVLVAEIPHTATGKISKKRLREQFADFSY
jgi:fatty-acyl-CoA synthase